MFFQAVDGECVQCNGPCRKTCAGPSKGIIHSGNIEEFQNCTVIEGSIAILETSFTGFQQVHQNYTLGEKYAPMHPDRLHNFNTLKEVTGYVNIQAYHPNFTNLSYFRWARQILLVVNWEFSYFRFYIFIVLWLLLHSSYFQFF